MGDGESGGREIGCKRLSPRLPLSPSPPLPYHGGMNNRDVAAIFDEIADLLEFQDANPFRVRAYRNAARRLSSPSEASSQTGAGRPAPANLPT